MLTIHSASWSYWGEVHPIVEGMTIPAWFGAVHNRWPHFKLVVEGASNRMLHQATPLIEVLLERIPQAILSTHLVSFGAKDLSTNLNFDCGNENLPKILAKSPKLREVRLDSTGGYRFHTHWDSSERLPSLKRLHLCGYLWTLPAGNVPGDSANWDISSLTHLELRESNDHFFFRSVPPSNFSHLRSLKMHSWPKPDGAASLNLLADERQHLIELRTAIDHINALEELCISCWLSELPLSAITRHGATLKSLMLYDHGRYKSFPSISVNYLETIRSSCPHLMALGLNLRNCNFEVCLHSKPGQGIQEFIIANIG